MIAAALLDPSAQHIEAVSEWLLDNNKTRSEVLRDAMIDFKINSDNEHHHHQQQQQHNDSMNNNVDNIRLKLLKKYSVFNSSGDTGIDKELQNFVNLRDEVSDVLAFWRAQEINYPNLAKLAKVLLSKHTSSAKSESAFSVAGVLLSKKRALIEPWRAQKVLFIHDNYYLCKSVI